LSFSFLFFLQKPRIPAKIQSWMMTKTCTLLVSWKGNWRPCQREKASSVWVRLVDPKISKLFAIFIFIFIFFTHYTH
jgi:hypothetical protein